MLNVLLFCKQIDISKKLLNRIIGNIQNLRLIGIATTENEVNKIMEETEPNIIITTEINIIELIKTKYITYKPSIVLITNHKDLNENDNILILDFHLTFSEMTIRILKFVKNNIQNSYREKVIKTLLDLNFDFNLSGTLYLLDAILYVHSYKGSYCFEKLNRDIYTYVAKENLSTQNKVKWSIERAINYMYKNHTRESYKTVEKFFGITYPQKPTPKLLISIFANKIE